MMIITFSSPLTDDRGDQGPVLVVIHAGVAGRPREALHLVWDTWPPRTGLRGPVASSDWERASGGAISLLQPALVPPEVRPELVQPVSVLCQLALRSFVWIHLLRSLQSSPVLTWGPPMRGWPRTLSSSSSSRHERQSPEHITKFISRKPIIMLMVTHALPEIFSPLIHQFSLAVSSFVG